MKLNSTKRKLQRAILTTGLVIKIGQTQFYSKEQNRMITIYILSTPIYTDVRGKWKTKDYEILRTASAVEVVMCLAEIWEEVNRGNS